ncbi:MAG: hypothetical protein V4731_01255 [Pseudomonadota bacterium]
MKKLSSTELPFPRSAQVSADVPSELAEAASKRSTGRVWVMALAGAAAWQFDPALSEMAELVTAVACSGNKSVTQNTIAHLRSHAESARVTMAPLQARLLSRLLRRTEAACGAVLDKRARLEEVQAAWTDLLTCLNLKLTPGQRQLP